MDQSIKAGVYGFLLAVVINLFSPIYLDFIPSFLVAILAIYIFRLGFAQTAVCGNRFFEGLQPKPLDSQFLLLIQGLLEPRKI